MINSELLNMFNLRLWLAALLILLVSTHLFFRLIDHFEPVTDNLLLNSSFEHGGENWQAVDDHGLYFDQQRASVQLYNSDKEKSIFIRQYLDRPSHIRYFRVTAVLSTDSVIKGDKNWHTARVVFTGIDQSGSAMWRIPHMVVSKEGSHRKQSYSQIFETPDNVTKLMLMAQLSNAKGSMTVYEISVYGVQQKIVIEYLKWVMALFWGLFLIWSMYLLYRILQQTKMSFVVLICAIAIGALTLISGDMKSFLALELMGTIGGESIDAEELIRVSGAGHFLLFTLLSLITLFGFRHIQTLNLLGSMAIFASVTETLQFFAINRNPSTGDFLLDIAGISLGFIVYYLYGAVQDYA